MAIRRFKPTKENVVFHCVSRIVGAQFLLGPLEKERLIQLMWRQADFCGLNIFNFCVMSNHYHMLVEVPEKILLTNEQILDKLKRYYGKSHEKTLHFEKLLEKDDPYIEQLREKYLAMMGDISPFQKLCKQIFSTWYNRTYERKGTLWMERFQSNVVQDKQWHILNASAYITLNPIRADIVEDPAEYRFSMYAAAVAGDERCRGVLRRLTRKSTWKEAHKKYRKYIICKGVADMKKNGCVIKEELLKEMEANNGQLPLRKLLHLKVRYFIDSLAIGSEAYLERLFEEYRDYFSHKRTRVAYKPKGGDWGSLYVMRNLRKEVFG